MKNKKKQVFKNCGVFNIKGKNHSLSVSGVEEKLANELRYYQFDGNEINAQDVSIADLWDLSEEHARTWYKRWVWPSLR